MKKSFLVIATLFVSSFFVSCSENEEEIKVDVSTLEQEAPTDDDPPKGGGQCGSC